MTCKHKRKKKVFTHGKNSPSNLVCKDCGNVLRRYEVIKKRVRRNNRP